MFFFGSLRDRELLEVVLDRAVADADLAVGWAPDHATLRMQGEPYPWLAEVPGARAEGVVLSGLTAADLERLEYFEEAEYGLSPITVDTDAGAVEAVFFATTGKLAGNDQPWDFAAWQRDSRLVAVKEAELLMGHFGVIPIGEIDLIWDEIKALARKTAKNKL